MSDTTGWTYTTASRRCMYKNLPQCRIEVRRGFDGQWHVSIDSYAMRPTKAEAQRLAHAIARALENVE